MRTKVVSDNIANDPKEIAEWAKSYAAKKGITKLEFEKMGDKWKLTIHRRE